MENTFTYGITGNEAGMTVAEYLKSRGYSSRLVVRLRNTPGSFFVDGTAVFSTCVLKDGNQLQVRVAEKGAPQLWSLFPWIWTSYMRIHISWW